MDKNDNYENRNTYFSLNIDKLLDLHEDLQNKYIFNSIMDKSIPSKLIDILLSNIHFYDEKKTLTDSDSEDEVNNPLNNILFLENK